MPRPPIATMRSDLSGLTWIVLRGELDLAGAGILRADLTGVCEAREHVVIDARDVTFIDLAGLRVLAALERQQHRRGARFSLVAGDVVRRLARLGSMQLLLECERHPDELLGIVGLHDTGPESERHPTTAPAAVALEPIDHGRLRDQVAAECARQAALVARMVSLADRAQTALVATRNTARTTLAGRMRRDAFG